MTTRAFGSGALDPLLAAVDGRRLTATVARLAGPAFAGRRVGTPGNAAARAWLGQHLADLSGAVGFDGFAVTAVPEVYAAPEVSWRDGRAVRRLEFGRDVAVHLASAEEPLIRRGPIGVAGQGDPVGRWLLVPPGMSLFDAYGHGYRAAGLLVGRGVDADGWQYTVLAGPNPGPLPVLTLDTTLVAVARLVVATAWLTATTPARVSSVIGD